MRIVPDELHIRDSEFYEEFYAKQGRADKYAAESARFGTESSTFATPDARLHSMRRAALNPFFSRQRIIALEGSIRHKAKMLVDNIRKFKISGKPFNLKNAWNAFVGDVITEYSFAIDYDHLNSEGFDTNWHQPVWAVTATGPLAMQFPVIPKIMNSLPLTLVEKLDPLFAMLVKLQRDLASEITKVKDGRSEKDGFGNESSIFWSIQNNPDIPSSEKSARRLIDESQLLLGAGLLTTAWAMSVGSFHIINDIVIARRLHDELEDAIPDPSAPDAFKWVELEKLSYLSACIKESIRLSYPATHRSQRVFDKPLRYKDWIIPARTPIGMNQTDVLKDEKIFPNHEVFNPDRWIDPKATAYGPPVDKFMVLFGKGARSCLGINLAWCELYLGMAAVFRNFHFELYETDASDVEVKHDFWLPSPKLDSRGVRVRCIT